MFRGHSRFEPPPGFMHAMPRNIVQRRVGKRGSPVDPQYYTLLNVDPNATSSQIKKAYRKMSLTKHPDKGGNAEAFSEITKAYEVLSSEEERMCYDAFGVDYTKEPQLVFFRKSIRGDSINTVISLSLRDCMKGKECKIQYPRRQANGLTETVRHSFYVPPNTRHEKVFTFANMGHHESGKIPGSLVVVIRQQEDPDFKRAGDILLHRKAVPLAVMLLGEPVPILHPLGHTFYLETKENHWKVEKPYKAQGQGCNNQNPMYIQFSAEFPDLNLEQRRKLAAVLGYNPRVSSASDVRVVGSCEDEQNVQKELRRSQLEAREDGESDSENIRGAPPGCVFQ